MWYSVTRLRVFHGRLPAGLARSGSPVSQSSLDHIALLPTNGMTVQAAESYCLQQGLDPDACRRAVAEARQD